MRRRLLVIAAVALVCLGVVLTRAVWEGRSALDAGDRALKEGEPSEAIAEWRRAARWYVPGAPHVTGALDRLEELGTSAAERADLELALSAWRGVYGSIQATRSVYTPHPERLERARREISELMARQEAERAEGDTVDLEERTAWHHQLLARDEAPSVFWSIVALLGFGLWVGGGFTFALRGVTPDDRLVRRTAAIAGGMVAIGLLVWVLGLYNA